MNENIFDMELNGLVGLVGDLLNWLFELLM